MSKKTRMVSLMALVLGIALVLILVSACGKKKQATEVVVPAPYAGMKNPFNLSDQQTVASGKSIYTANCLSCHGEKGDGKGPAAAGLKPAPADFTSPDRQKKFDEAQDYIFWRVSEGFPGTAMPAWKNVLNETQRWQVITYEWSLSKK
ncbi:MAG: cytochrome c [Chloroflexi bacterium]|nr:cytochrome c [Chloroflexota bacterium]